MLALNRHLDIEGFLARLRHARERVLLLDYDGTLAPFHADPRLALPYPRVRALLGGIMTASRTRIVIVSGRPLESLRVPLALLPHSEAWASHGWERVVGRKFERRVPCREAREQLDRAVRLAQPLVAEGARIEVKVAGVAVHWRGLPRKGVTRVQEALQHVWQGLADEWVARLPFDGGLEARARGRDKGDAVREVLSGCSPETSCAYLGDDHTDEDAFRAIRGRGLSVLVRARYRETQAELWISQPRELSRFLERWQAAASHA